MSRKFRHTKSNFVVTHNGYGRYVNETNALSLAPMMVEDTAEWKEVLPIYDEYGMEIKEGDLFYSVCLMDNGSTLLVNRHPPKDYKVLAIYRDYKEACRFEKVYNALKKIQEYIITPSGLPSAYLKKIIKLLSENKK
jgi:hypothetical protein